MTVDFANIINVPVPGSPRFELDTAMAIARLRASLGPAGCPAFTSLAISGLTLTGLSGVLKATAGIVSGGGAHADLATVTANQHHNQAHVLNGADHTVSGLTTGHVLQATGATTFGFAAVPGLHDAVTLATSADVLLGLTGQALSLDTQTAAYVLAGPLTGAAAAPTFRALALTDFPTITVGYGGTGVTTLTTAYGLLAAGTTPTGAVQTLAAGATTQILVGGGASALPAWGTDLPTAVTIGSKYVYRAEGTDIPVADGGTGKSVFAVGDIIHATATTTLAGLADVAVGSYLRSGGVNTVPLWSTLILPNAATAFRIPVATSANTVGELAAVGATGEYLKGNTGAIPSWATLNQAAVAGLTTVDSPQFANVNIISGAYPILKMDASSAENTYSLIRTYTTQSADGITCSWFNYDGGSNAGTGFLLLRGTTVHKGYVDFYASGSRRLRLDEDGRILINKTSGTEQLEVNGTIRSDTKFNLNGSDGVTQAASAGKISIPTAVAGGIITAQSQITYAADGTYALPTSITISKGIITAIS